MKTDFSQLSLPKLKEEMRAIKLQKPGNWYKLYLLLKTIEIEELFEEDDATSMSDWINKLCSKKNSFINISRSRIYQIKQAGRFLDDYLSSQKEIEVKHIPDPLTILNIKKIIDVKGQSGTIDSNALNKELDTLMDQAFKGIINRNKTAKIYKGLSVPNEMAFERIFLKQLSNDYSWLGEKEKAPSNFLPREKREKAVRNLYQVLASVQLPNKRRTDAVVYENLTSETSDHVNCHIFELRTKVDPNSTKVLEGFKSYGDFIWLVLPESEIPRAQNFIPEGIGIMKLDESNHSISIHRKAEKNKANTVWALENYILHKR